MRSEYHCENHHHDKWEWWGYEEDELHYFHRENGPASIWYHCDSNIPRIETYWVNNLVHRVDGPAQIQYDENGNAIESLTSFHLLNLEVTKEQFETPGFIDAFILEHS